MLDKKNAPWVYTRGEPFRVIAALELYAVLVAIVTFCTDKYLGAAADRIGTIRIGGSTDNQSNHYLLQKYLTTKYPLGCILMEVAAQCHARLLQPSVQWIPRMQNVEADALTNEEFDAFSLKNRIPIDVAQLPLLVLPKLLEHGEKFLTQRDALKEERAKQAKRQKEKKEPLSLRLRDPW